MSREAPVSPMANRQSLHRSPPDDSCLRYNPSEVVAAGEKKEVVPPCNEIKNISHDGNMVLFLSSREFSYSLFLLSMPWENNMVLLEVVDALAGLAM
ncbi:hypothetical protein HAX54_000820 [Datura stramonium]|uniref:Uncharacterized protein n=1 Tax=Datura stramonium TaxID=4076 RepID=A0ABS8T3T1_DATST|nr:hypothetical protein [Datura stramonium]